MVGTLLEISINLESHGSLLINNRGSNSAGNEKAGEAGTGYGWRGRGLIDAIGKTIGNHQRGIDTSF